MIENGQWGVFLHRRAPKPEFGSTGAVVYHGTDAENKACDWILAWKNPYDKSQHKNTAYTEVREINHFYNDDNTWKRVRDGMKKFKLADKSNHYGCLSSVKIGEGRYSHFTAVLTLEKANENTR
ncbi:hypothetical protein FEM48_ZijujUnG0109200 [Ziziphus jujuba var. spinosa]|uniref:23 kDa jasmonate-induced protein-like n=1 Tax=Ziziphus jujuba var. spinosa TaxID=714518 RepID=A0A978U828_ZIZJJ|nr:hypothetical protein FEM48_ZijujUnG0109200 [Ziziphus jujuba var. spinosa]